MRLKFGMTLAAGLALVALIAGCPAPSGKATLTTALTASMDEAKDAGVPIEEIDALNVTIERIVLVPVGTEDEDDEGDDPGDDPGDDEGDDAKQDLPPVSPEHVLVFEGEMVVNLMDLTGVAEVVSQGEVPAGTYSQIRLNIANPELYRNGAEEPETNIQLTANGRLFITGQFTIGDGASSVLLINFGGIHLVELGNGNYVLTPQIRADVTVEEVPALLAGTILSVDAEADTMAVSVADGEGDVTVDYSGAAIVLAGGGAGTEADLTVGAAIDMQGELAEDGTFAATTVQLQ